MTVAAVAKCIERYDCRVIKVTDRLDEAIAVVIGALKDGAKEFAPIVIATIRTTGMRKIASRSLSAS